MGFAPTPHPRRAQVQALRQDAASSSRMANRQVAQARMLASNTATHLEVREPYCPLSSALGPVSAVRCPVPAARCPLPRVLWDFGEGTSPATPVCVCVGGGG